MTPTIEKEVSSKLVTQPISNLQADEIARDLKLMDEIEALAQSLALRTEGRSPTTQEIREMAYEDREASLG